MIRVRDSFFMVDPLSISINHTGVQTWRNTMLPVQKKATCS
jgi:hypothetical protein